MPDHQETIALCQSCGARMDVSALAPFSNVECPHCGKHTRVKREFGPYTLVRRHAIGGMSMVFAAHDNTLAREVALKILSEEFSADERRIAAFEEEARITASFSHPHVVRVLRTGRAFGRFYIAMEFVPGGHFEHQIRERGKIPEVELLPLAIEVAQGLKAAHAAGLIHRDVKPGNILLDAEGHAKLVDFGLALVTKGGKARAKELWATPYYVPPETVEGYDEDFRSDIYALGATLYHALCGRPSCGEETMATDILREAKKKVIPLSAADAAISAETCGIVEKAMAYHPSERFGSYDALIASLAVSLSHLKSGRPEPTERITKRRAEKKRRERKTAIIGAVAILVATAAALWWLNQPEPEAAPVPEVVVTPPADDGSPSTLPDADAYADISRNYREARAALASREFETAAARFRDLLNNPTLEEPTRTWAGLESVLAHFLNGHPADARDQARETKTHMRLLPEGARRISGGLVEILDQLGDLPAVPAPDSPEAGAPRVIAAMLAGLKNWEQGMTGPAADCFRVAASAILPPEDQWAAVYQEFAADYLSDHEVLGTPVFNVTPADKAACKAAIDELDEIHASLKTRGRARFNVRAWQLDLARRAKRLGDAPPPPLPPDDEPPAVLDRLREFASDYRFREAVTYLQSVPAGPNDAETASLRALAESAAGFLANLENDLTKTAAAADLPLKSGESMTRVFIDGDGRIIATSADGENRVCQWVDFSPEALIALHRVLVKKPTSDHERLRRHECAIAFEWLAGSRERALAAAAVLSQGSPSFKNRWDAVSAGLPK